MCADLNRGHTTATDLADLEGDGDIDWIVSRFGCSRRDVFRNDGGDGVRAFVRRAGEPACALPADFDNDGDVDLALLDETTDLILNMENACRADGDGILNIFDFLAFQSAVGNGDPEGDFNGDGVTNVSDILAFQSAYGTGC